MTSSDELLASLRENDLASAMAELTHAVQALRQDTASSQAAGVRFDTKLLQGIARLAELTTQFRDGVDKVSRVDAESASTRQALQTLSAAHGELQTALTALQRDTQAAAAVTNRQARERIDAAVTGLQERLTSLSDEVGMLPKQGFKGPPGKPGKEGPPGQGLPAGGSEGQIPVKASDDDFDIVWRSPPHDETAAGAFTIWNAAGGSSGSSVATNGLPVGGTAGQVLSKVDGTDYNAQWVAVAGTGTVTTVSVTTANGVSGTVANATSTPAITLTLGAITPTSVAASGAVTGSNLSGTNTGNQTITLTGDVTGSGTGSFAATIAASAVTLAKMADMATSSLIYRKTAGTGAPEVNTLATVKTDLLLTGTNSGDQTITLTGDVTGSGTSSFAATVANNAVTYAKMQDVSATDKVLGRSTAGAGDPEEIACTATGRSIIDDTSIAAVITTLGLDNNKIATISFVIDGGGSAITTGVKGDLEIPFACTINRVTTLADQSGSIVVDIWKDTYASYPPTVADTITASAKPTLSSAAKAQDSTLTGWTTSIAAGDTLRFNVDSITTCQRVLISLKVTKT